MLESELIEQLKESNSKYLCKGPHYLKVSNRSDLENRLELIIEEDLTKDESLETVCTEIWAKIKTRIDKKERVQFFFTGDICQVSEIELQKWFLRFLSFHTSKISTYFLNKKLKILTAFIDSFLTVYSTEDIDVIKGNIQHTFLLSPDPSHSNIKSKLIWFDHSLLSGGTRVCSSYKIFYYVAIEMESQQVNPTTNRLVEQRFMTPKRVEAAKSAMKNIQMILKQINYTEKEIKQIFQIIMALIELSQYRAHGNGNKLEFNGSGHFQKVAEYLQVKEKQLRDFVVNEYSWIDGKRKLNSPDVINYEIDAFIAALYNVLMRSILKKYNKFEEIKTNKAQAFRMDFFNSLSLPHFDKENVFPYGCFSQYYFGNYLQSISADFIGNKVNKFISCCPSQKGFPKNFNVKNCETTKQLVETVDKLIADYKKAKSKSDYLQKLEKTEMKEIKLFKINNGVFLDVFIQEFKSFIRFNWQSFVEGSEVYCSKLMEGFLKLSGNPVIRNYKRKKNSNGIWLFNDLNHIWHSKDPFDESMYFIHSLINQPTNEMTLKHQINKNKLGYLMVNEICFPAIALDVFVARYRVAFLNYDDHSKTRKDAVQHGITRLQLNDAWCCNHYIHLQSHRIKELDSMVSKYHEYVVKIQRYAKIILAKLQLKKLKQMSDFYKEEYLEAVTRSNNIQSQFNMEYLPILNVDKENIDLKLLEDISPNLPDLEIMKSVDRNDTPWLCIQLMSGRSFLHKEHFSNSTVCLFLSKENLSDVPNCLDIGKYLSQELKCQINNSFIIKITNHVSGDVFVDVKTKMPLFVWNVETEINKLKRQHLPLSRGYLHSRERCRIFSNDYFIKKMAYNTLTGLSYPTFSCIVQECSTAIAVEFVSEENRNLYKCPLWISITNCLPLINLSSTSTFNAVENQRRIIDKTECSKYAKGPHLRPKDDWLMENLSTKLLFNSAAADISMKKMDSVDLDISRRFTFHFHKGNYKIRKYLHSNS